MKFYIAILALCFVILVMTQQATSEPAPEPRNDGDGGNHHGGGGNYHGGCGNHHGGGGNYHGSGGNHHGGGGNHHGGGGNHHGGGGNQYNKPPYHKPHNNGHH